jgi:hypothetical protein
MPLASLFTHHFYGEAAMASVTSGQASSTAGIKGFGRQNSTVTGTASVPLAKPTRLVNSPATVQGSGSVVQALPKAFVRPSATVRVNQLTQDDVTGAVLEAQVEPGLTLKQAILDARKAAKLAAALSA